MGKKNESLVLWDKELAERAKRSVAAVANLGGGQFFSIKGGKLSFGDTKMPNNEVVVVALAHRFENTYYEGEYDPETSSSPACYAFAETQDELKPHEAVKSPCHEQCKGCPNNEFGTAVRGRGKACKNRIRIACIAAGSSTGGRFEPFEGDALKAQPIAYLGVPVTSLGAWGRYVKDLFSAGGKDIANVYTKVRVVPDEKVQVRIEFEAIADIKDTGAKEAVYHKVQEAEKAIVFPYPEREDAPKKARGKKRRRGV